jgi:glutamate synthase (NADPH/NADH)
MHASLHLSLPVYIMYLWFQVLCWRTVPTESAGIGVVARNSEPFMRQVFVTGDQDEETLKRQVTGR